MQRSLVFALILLIAAVLGGIWLLSGGGSAAPVPPPVTSIDQPENIGPAVASGTGTVLPENTATVREAVAVRGSELLEDPNIRAGLCGFKGRVVTHLEVPVPDCGVRIYRGALDSVLQTRGDLFAEEQEFAPDYIAGEVRTAQDGTWQMTGIWPRGFYLMFAGLGTDAPTHQIITKSPSPGEVVDLGDIVLNDAGVIVGTVYDDNGEPMQGALVRAADIPGALAAFFPVERFDPEGAVLIREPQAPVHVVQMPPWVKHAFEHLPIPTDRTGADGSFRLVGVMPGSNMLATTAPSYLSDVKPSVQVRAGQERDVGRIRLRQGEELIAQVVDEKGDPVVGAEVVAGSTMSMAPVDLAQNLGKTDEQGHIEGFGFSPGKVTVAARRGPNDAWVLAEPQSILGEVLVTLPALYGVTVTVTLADGSPAKSPTFRLLYGRKGDGAAEMYLLGFSKPVSLEGRQEQLDEGQWQLRDLHAGTYTLLAEVAGHATGSAVFTLMDADAVVALKLAVPNVFTVRVVDQEDRPIRNVAIFAEPRGERVVKMPVRCGRTNKDGQLVIDKLQADSLRVSADHPRWGVVHGEAEKDKELLLRLLEPGKLHGVLRENGKTPLPGKYTVAVMLRRGGGARGPLEQVPSLQTAGMDGSFMVTALQPGNYRVAAISSIDTLRSPGGIFSLAQSMFINSRMPTESVDVVSGQTAEVTLDVGEKPLEGPTAQLTGSVVVDGRVASGYTITARCNGRRFAAVVDERGRFDLGIILAGSVSVSVMGSEGGLFMGSGSDLWSSSFELKQGELRDLTIDITTSTVTGACYLPDGSPASNVFVQARGKMQPDGDSQVRMSAATDANGVFRFTQVPAAEWSLEVRGGTGDERWRGNLEGIQVAGGVPVVDLRIDLVAPMTVKGRVDLSGFGQDKPQWGWVGFRRLQDNDPDGARGTYTDGVGIDSNTGKFVAEELTAGRFRITYHTWSEESQKEFDCGIVVVPPTGLVDLVLVPRAK